MKRKSILALALFCGASLLAARAAAGRQGPALAAGLLAAEDEGVSPLPPGRYELSLRFDLSESEDRYDVIAGTRTGVYQEVLTMRSFTLTTRGTGPLAAKNQRIAGSASGMPGDGTADGQSRLLALSRDSAGQPLVQFEFTGPLNGQVTTTRHEAKASFVRGSWSDYDAGKAVELELAPEGQQQADQATSELWQDLMAQTRRAIMEQAKPGFELSPFVLRVSSLGRARMSGDRRQMIVREAETTVEAKAEVLVK